MVDIDGSIASWKKRAEKAGVMPCRSKLEHFQAWLDAVQNEKSLSEDEPIIPVVETVLSLRQQGHTVVFLTGRSEIYREVTEAWITHHLFIKQPAVFMRGKSDYRSAAAYKRDKLTIILENSEEKFVMAIDDDHDGDMADVYNELGIVHLKVMGIL